MEHTLPAELALEICRLLDIQDIKNLRLVSKYHNDLAIPFLFHQLQLVFHAESFDRLLAVAQHPVISKEIKSLYYEPALIEDHESRDRWERHVQSPVSHHDFLHQPIPCAVEEEAELY